MDYNRKIPTNELIYTLVLLVPMIYFIDEVMLGLFFVAILGTAVSFAWQLFNWLLK